MSRKYDKFSKKIGIMVLSIIMFFTVFQSMSTCCVDAASKINGVIVLTDNNKIKIAECVEGQYSFRAVYNKYTETVSIIKVGLMTGEICSTTWISLSKSTATTAPAFDQRINHLAASVYSQTIFENTYADYEYTKWYGSPNKWELRRPATTGSGTQGFRAYQTSKNETYLKGFYSAVNKINQKELTLIGLVGITALIGIVGLICTGGLAAFLAAAGFTATSTAEAASLQATIKSAKNYYWDAYYSSTRF